MNQAISKLRNPNHIFWLLVCSIVVILYVPLFFFQYDLRQEQIKRGMRSENALPVLGSDSLEYSILARNLVSNKTFSLDGVTPETFRTIGYPGFVSLYLARGLPLPAFPLVQIIMVVATSYLIFLIGKELWRGSIGIAAAVLYLVDPVTILNTMTIVTDTFYVFLLVLVIYFFFISRLDDRLAWTFGGIFLGLSTLVRPISMFLLVIFIAIYLVKSIKSKYDLRIIGTSIILCLVFYSAILLPWVIRNKKVTGVFGISTVKSYNLYHYYVPEFLTHKNNISTSDARIEVGRGLGDFDERSLANASKMEQRAKSFIFDDPVKYVFFHAIKTIPFFISSGMETIFTGYNDVRQENILPVIEENLSSLLLKGRVGELFKVISRNPAIGSEQVILLGFWLLAVLSLYVGFKRREFFNVALLWIIIIYFATLTGPVAYSRYRLPATPFLFLLATYAIVIRSYAPPHNHAETR